MRIEKKFCDFWFNTAKHITEFVSQTISCGLMNLMYAPAELTEKDLFKAYQKLIDDSPGSSVCKRFTVFYEDRFEVLEAANSKSPELVVQYSTLKSIEQYKGMLAIK